MNPSRRVIVRSRYEVNGDFAPDRSRQIYMTRLKCGGDFIANPPGPRYAAQSATKTFVATFTADFRMIRYA
jgi:hypothetical protein